MCNLEANYCDYVLELGDWFRNYTWVHFLFPTKPSSSQWRTRATSMCYMYMYCMSFLITICLVGWSHRNFSVSTTSTWSIFTEQSSSTLPAIYFWDSTTTNYTVTSLCFNSIFITDFSQKLSHIEYQLIFTSNNSTNSLNTSFSGSQMAHPIPVANKA